MQVALQRKNTQMCPISFYEEAVCKRGTKWNKGLLVCVGNFAM